MPKAKKKTEAAAVAEPAPETIESIKGYDKDLRCRDHQYEIGKTYEHKGIVVACPTEAQAVRGEGGFHAISGNPLEVLRYYPPASSRYTLTTQSGVLARHSADSKIASAVITIGVELHLHELIERAMISPSSSTKSSGGRCSPASSPIITPTSRRGRWSSTPIDSGAARSRG